MRSFKKIYEGHAAPDIEQLIGNFREIDKTVVLDGFSDNGVSYRSHKFEICLTAWKEKSIRNAFVCVRHGGGHEVWQCAGVETDTFERLIEAKIDNETLFRVCWALIQAADDGERAGYQNAATCYKQAFVEGRLKKRRLPAKGLSKVWIEPQVVPNAA
jgi:hypothetical protein